MTLTKTVWTILVFFLISCIGCSGSAPRSIHQEADLSYDQVFDACKASVANLGYRIRTEDREKGFIHGQQKSAFSRNISFNLGVHLDKGSEEKDIQVGVKTWGEMWSDREKDFAESKFNKALTGELNEVRRREARNSVKGQKLEIEKAPSGQSQLKPF